MAPQLGLARPGPQLGTTTPLGTSVTSSDETELVHDDSGEISGQQRTRETRAGAGTGSAYEHKSHVTDGRTTKTSETETELFAGAEAAAKLITLSSANERKVAVETLARAGAFGKAAQKKSFQRGRASASYAAEGEAGAGIEAKLEAEAKIDRTGAIPAIEAMIEAGLRAGVWVNGKFTGNAALGPLALAVCAEIEAMAGAEAKFEAKLIANLKEGISGEFSASAFVGAKAKVAGSVELKLGPAALEAKGEAEASAGAGAELEAGFVVRLTSVSANFKAEAFAGAKASAKGEASFKLMGKKIISAKGKVEVSAGVGGEAEGEFAIGAGKLKISGGLSATLGVGGGASAGFEVDAGILSQIIVAQVHELAKDSSDPVIKDKSPDYERTPLTDPVEAAKKHKVGYDAVHDSFVAYANKKAMEGKGFSRPVQTHQQVLADGLTEEGIKRSRVQEIIATCAPLIRAEMPFVETDQGIQQAALDAFAGHLKSITVQHGVIREWGAAPRADAAKVREKTQEEERWRAARDDLKAELDGYCAKQAGKTGSAVQQDAVQKIVAGHWSALSAAFPREGEAARVVDFVAAEMKSRFLKSFSVDKTGTVTLESDPVKTAQLQADTRAGVARSALEAKLRPGLTAYRLELVKDPRGVPTAERIRKLVSSAGGTGPQLQASADLVNETLEGIALVKVRDGALSFMFDMTALMDARTALRADAAAATREKLLADFSAALLDYQELKTGTGKRGMKQTEVAARLAKLTGALSAEDRADATLDRELEKAATDALGPALLAIQIEGAVVTSFVPDHQVMDQAKADRKAYGKAKLAAGPEADNQRRQVVAAALRHELAALAKAASTVAEKDPKATTPKIEAVKVQKVVDKALRSHLADVRNPVGDAAVATAIEVAFPWVEGPVVDNLTIRSMPVRSGFTLVTGARRQASAAVQQAVLDISKEIQAFRKQPSMDDAQRVLDRYQDRFRGLEAAEADALRESALQSGVRARASERVESVTVEGGRVTSFVLGAGTGQAVR